MVHDLIQPWSRKNRKMLQFVIMCDKKRRNYLFICRKFLPVKCFWLTHILLIVSCLAGWAHELSVDPLEVVDAEVEVPDVVLKSTRVYADNSVLSSGNWVKVRVTTSGIKRLTKSALAQMGFSDASKVSVYGNGGAELPFYNATSRTDDLAQLSVLRQDGDILFYAEGVTTWSVGTSAPFTASRHSSDAYSYYYITDSGTPSPSPSTADASELTVAKTVESYDYRDYFHERKNNLNKSGRNWWGDSFSLTTGQNTVTFDLPEASSDATLGYVAIRFAARVTSATTYSVSVNDTELSTGSISAITIGSTTGYYAMATEKTIKTSALGGTTSVTVDVNFSSGTELAWLGYVTLISRTPLAMSGDELLFRNSDTYSLSGASKYVLSGASKSTVVWDISSVSTPKLMSTTYTNGALEFVHENASGSEFVAFNPSATFEAPEVVGTVSNQNLHAMQPCDYIILYHSDFREQAERLAELHRTYSGLTVQTACTDEIYNEFSSGQYDVSALRDFIKMLYDRGLDSGNELRYVLLFGNGTYDNMTVGTSNPRNKIPTYQSSQSLYGSQTYVTDDFFGWLDDSEGKTDLSNKVDVGIGRFPVQTDEEATDVVDKVETYLTGLDEGAWRAKCVFVADDGDSNEHFNYADANAVIVEKMHPEYNITKIYQEAYTSETTSTGVRYPQAMKDFENSINNGSLLMNYVGHGGYNALTDDQLLRQSYLQNYTNRTKLPFFITATCDFAPFDNLGDISIGEELLLRPYGGFIGLFTTTRLVYGDSNYKINSALYDRLLERDENDEPYRIGDAVKYAKQNVVLINSMKYVLLGDPALVLANESNLTVNTDSINGIAMEDEPNLSAIATSTISGSIRTADGDVDETFNGTVAVTLFDKKQTRKTLGSKSAVATFEEYSNTLYSGLVTVENGRFSVQFILSKDIDFDEGYGRVSYYAWSSDGRRAIDADNQILISGITLPTETDTVGPQITMWVDYPEFVDGGVTGTNPMLYVTLEDPAGINTSGSGVGHDISLWIDDDRINAVTLNDYFTYDTGSSTKGTLTYSISGMEDGTHTFYIKAWDNLNNSSDKLVTVDVSPESQISFGQTQLYPQPAHCMSADLKLRFSHNDGGSVMTAYINVYSVNGQHIADSSISIVASQTQTDEIMLMDLLPEIRHLPSGLYFMKVDLESNSGRKGNFQKKLIVAQ